MEINNDLKYLAEMTLEERIANMQTNTESFFSIANLGDLNVTYRNRQVWMHVNHKDLFRVANSMLIEVPVSRQAVFYFIGNLLHESVHFYFLNKESVIKDANSSHVKARENENREIALLNLLRRIIEISSELKAKETFQLEVLEWLFDLFCELTRRNTGRPIFGLKTVLSSTFLNNLGQIPGVAMALQLLDSCFNILIRQKCDLAISLLIETSKQNAPNFNWICLHIVDVFPSEVIEQFVESGISEFKELCASMTGPDMKDGSLMDIRGVSELIDHLTPTRAIQLKETFDLRLQFFSELLAYLAQKRSLELKKNLEYIITKFREDAKNTDEMLFVIKIIINNPDILTPYVDDLIKYADGPLIQSLINLSLNPLLNAAISTSKVDEFLQKVIQNIGSNSLLEISKYLPFDF